MTQPPPPARPSPYPAADTAAGADLGRVGFIIAIVAVALAVGQQIAFAFLPTIQVAAGVGISAISLWIGAYGVIHTAASVAALVFGLLGAQRRRSLVLSGIAIGVGGAGVIAGVIGLVIVPLIGFAL